MSKGKSRLEELKALDEGAAYRILANSLLQLGMKEEAKEAYR